MSGEPDEMPDETARLIAQVADLKEVIYRISHDLQAPLRRVGAFSELIIRRTTLDARPTTWLKQIRDDAELAQRRLATVLDYSRIGRDWAPTRVSSSALLAQALRASAPEVRERVQVNGDPVSLCVDLTTMVQAIGAVLSNAGRFAAQTIELGARALDGDRFVIEVFDDGPGVAQRERALCRQLFYSSDPAAHAGLGLALAQRVMRLHHGQVTVTDRGGRGCLVRLEGTSLTECS